MNNITLSNIQHKEETPFNPKEKKVGDEFIPLGLFSSSQKSEFVVVPSVGSTLAQSVVYTAGNIMVDNADFEVIIDKKLSSFWSEIIKKNKNIERKMELINKKLDSLINSLSYINIKKSEETVGVTFKSRNELNRAFKKLFREKLPFEIVGFNSLVVPISIKEKLKNSNFKFVDLHITKLSDLSKTELNKVIEKREKQKEKGYKLLNDRYGK